MQKKIILFCVGLFVAVLGFFAYQYFTGAPLTSTIGPRDTTPTTMDEGPGASHPYIENRDENGVLIYVLTAERSLPQGGGEFRLIKPKATYYMHDGRVIAVTSDDGLVQVQQTGSKTNPTFVPLGGMLKDNVIITYGPKETFIPDSTQLQPGQIQITLTNPIEFDNAARLLSSDGPVSVHGDIAFGGKSHQVSFDGSDLKVLINQDQRRIELLRIEHGNTLTVKDVGGAAGGLAATTPGPPAPPAPSAAHGAVAITPPAPAPIPPAPAANVAVAATAPATDAHRIPYKVNFGTNVRATLGDLWLTSQRLQMIFAMGESDAVGDATVKPPVPSPAPAPGPVFAVGPAPAGPAPVPAATAPAKGSDFVITWTGPMEMRPSTPTDGVLANAQDRIAEAIGTDTIPVQMGDASGRSGRASHLLYHFGTQQAQLDASPTQAVELVDAALGKLRCRGVSIQQATGAVQCVGPGRLEMAQGGPRKPGQPAVDAKGPAIATWTKSLDLELLNLPDANNTAKKSPVVRHALFIGNADVQDPTSRIRADRLDVLFARPVGATTTQTLEHVLATGNVMVRSAKTPGVVGNNDDPSADFMQCQQMEVKSAVPAGTNIPQPSEMLATGDVLAVSHQVDKNDPKKVVVQQITAPSLLAKLAPKLAGGNTRADLGSFSVDRLQAVNGVKVQIDGMGTQMIVANSQTLVADPQTGVARLDGDPTLGRAAWASLRQGSNILTGPTIILQQKKQSAQIPGPGEFVFLQPSNKPDEQPSPVKVTWITAMDYDGKALLAHITGNVEAMLLGKPDQESRLNCDDLLVQMASAADTPDPVRSNARVDVQDNATTMPKQRLESITATGKVTATGANMDSDGKLIDRLYIRATELVYDDAKKTLTVPVPGDLLIEDYRPEPPPKPAGAPDTQPAEMGSTRGQTAFHWTDSLVYDGSSGFIHMKKDVFMRHKPEKIVAAKPDGVPDPKTSEVQLQCQDLLTELIQAKGTVANPLQFGTAGQTKVGKVTADTSAIMTLGNAQIAADSLIYDAANNKATAFGRNGSDATLIRPQGTAMAERIEWDMTKGSEGITLIGPRGNMEGP